LQFHKALKSEIKIVLRKWDEEELLFINAVTANEFQHGF